jgi:rhodanese-related sulfurtransferase
VYLDVRTEGEFSAYSVEDSFLLPIFLAGMEPAGSDWEEAIKGEWPVPVDAPSFVCGCKIGQRSIPAVMRLEALGYTAYNLEGGIDGWMREGLPIVTPQEPDPDDLFL